MKNRMSVITAFLALIVSVTVSAEVIVAGDIAIGINPEGHQNTSIGNVAVNSSRTGIAYSGIDGSFRDATSPGCYCEGWGVSASGISGHANVDGGGVTNLSVDSFTTSATDITSAVHLTSMPGLTVTQHYSLSSSDRLFEDVVTITNGTGGTLTDVRYVRVMDWDVPLTEFSEHVTIAGTATTTDLETSHDNGFCTADPLGGCSSLNPATEDVDFADDGPADHGAYFKFNFGDLGIGESKVFSIFYGAASTEAIALAALGSVSAELYSLGQSSASGGGDPVLGTPATFMFGFKGVGGVVPPGLPGPASLPLFGLGLIAISLIRRRQKLS
jgi:hypothetical protein